VSCSRPVVNRRRLCGRELSLFLLVELSKNRRAHSLPIRSLLVSDNRGLVEVAIAVLPCCILATPDAIARRVCERPDRDIRLALIQFSITSQFDTT
jgi:hypothetical protein